MTKRTTPIIVGNWKTTPPTLDIAIKFVKQLDKTCSSLKTKNKIPLSKKPYYLAVPDIFITKLKDIASGYIGAQNISGTKIEQETGLTTPSMITSAGADFSIIGHSEVRARGETEEKIAEKVALSLQSKMTTILCVGEISRDNQGDYISILEEDIKKCLSLVARNLFENLIIAYEPVWAIGNSTPATPHECFEAVIALRRALASIAGINYAKKVHILYGGTVTSENARAYLEEGGVDGLLIGRASQEVSSFSAIIKSCNFQ